MSDDEKNLYDQALPGDESREEGKLLKYVLVGVLAMFLYGVVTLLLAAGVI